MGNDKWGTNHGQEGALRGSGRQARGRTSGKWATGKRAHLEEVGDRQGRARRKRALSGPPKGGGEGQVVTGERPGRQRVKVEDVRAWRQWKHPSESQRGDDRWRAGHTGHAGSCVRLFLLSTKPHVIDCHRGQPNTCPRGHIWLGALQTT